MIKPTARELSATASAAAAALREWLLAGPAQIRTGSEAGAVAGTVDLEGRAEYAYGEITGYYLQWLSSAHLRRAVEESSLCAHASAAIAWCERRYIDPAQAPTRIPLLPNWSAATADWRNQARFCFDPAMLVGGIVAARRRNLVPTPRGLLDGLLKELSHFARTEGLAPVRVLESKNQLPDRWSTRPGAFLVKAAARILSAQALVEVPELLELACQEHLERFAQQAPAADLEPLHPTLYFLEGELALGSERNERSALLLKALMRQGDSDGNLWESSSTRDIRRADIVAQALRIGVLLRACGERKAPTESVLDRLAHNLVSRIRSDGSIAFRENADPPQLNVWCAMFAEQALSWHAQWRGAKTLDANAWDIV